MIASSLASINILIVVLGAALGFFSVRRAVCHYRDECADLFLGYVGLAGIAIGLSLQRGYWAINRALEAVGESYVMTVLYQKTSWITLIPLWMIVIGVGMLMAPWLDHLFGGRWLVKYLAVCVSAWVTISVLL